MRDVIRGRSPMQSSREEEPRVDQADWFGRIRNKAKLRPIELVDPRNKELRTALQTAEMQVTMGGDTVNDDEDEPDGPGSESD